SIHFLLIFYAPILSTRSTQGSVETMPAISGLVLRCCGRSSNDAAAADAAADAAKPADTEPPPMPDPTSRQLPESEPAAWHPSLVAFNVYEPQSMAAAAASAGRVAPNTAAAAAAAPAVSPMKSEPQRQPQQSCRACLQGCQPNNAWLPGCSSLRRYQKRSESPMFNPYLRPRSCTSLEDIRIWSQRKTSALLMAAAAATAAATADLTDSGTAESNSNCSIDCVSYASDSSNANSRSPPDIELSGYFGQ
ncbi:hypothetical protein BOX15_Mlig009026g3, partial [Macrostomum lignano]